MFIQILSVLTTMVISINAFNNFADTKCGQNNIWKTSRVVGGQNAIKGEFPWLVSITRRGGHFCGGTVINKNFIMTAGHCLCTGVDQDMLKPAHIKVTMSQHNLADKDASSAYAMTVKSITIHPDYHCNRPNDDIAILELDRSLEWSEGVLPACLPNQNVDKLDDSLATVAGWGWTNEDGSKGGRAKILQKAKVNVINSDKCQVWYKSQGKKTKIQQGQICAGHEQGGIDACWADSGGPLMVKLQEQKQMMVVGVVSTGIGCARPYLPGIYTRVSNYIPWIKQVIGK